LGQFGPVLWRSWVTNIRDPALLRGRIIHGLVSVTCLINAEQNDLSRRKA